MSGPQVERLQALLTRVQTNRSRPRAPQAGTAEPMAVIAASPVAAARPAAAAVQPAAAAPVAAAAAREPSRGPVPRERASIVEERVNIPDRVSVAQKPAARAPSQAVQPPARESIAQEPAAGARKPMRDRTATPLEMALEGELSRPLAAAPAPAPVPRPAAAPAPRSPTASTERLMPAVTPQQASEADLERPLTLEAEPIAEATRPIAQVVSKHAPQLDATFGAMLKRSLSLRPH
ncbi:MAG TPA: hypothetical protein VF331_10570 [Polyangiales bacterium]